MVISVIYSAPVIAMILMAAVFVLRVAYVISRHDRLMEEEQKKRKAQGATGGDEQ